MTEIWASIRYNLGNLARFSGRETRGQFWPYTLFLFIVAMFANILLMAPLILDMMIRFQRFAVEHPQGLPEDPLEPGMRTLPPDLMLDLSPIAVPMAAITLLFVLLVAAAAVRRLHDRDKTGLWAALPLPFTVIGQMMTPYVADGMTGRGGLDPIVMPLIALNSVFYWAALILLAVMLAQPGTTGPNRYGPEPRPGG